MTTVCCCLGFGLYAPDGGHFKRALHLSEHNEEAATEKPRFLLFSDSVQDAAQRAAVPSLQQPFGDPKSLFTAVEETTDRKMTLSEAIHTLPTSLTTQTDASRFVATFTTKDQSWRKNL